MSIKNLVIFLGFLVALIFTFGNYVPDEVWNFCRSVNRYLGLVAFLGVTTRLGMMLGDKKSYNDARSLHLMFWFGWICVSLLNASLGATYYNSTGVDANYTSGIRMVLHLTALGLSIWWPDPHKYKEDNA